MSVATRRPSTHRSLRWFALPATAVLFAVGVWLAGGVVTNSFRTSMALVALWYLLAASTLRGRVVDEPVLVGTPASQVDATSPRSATVKELTGGFVSGEHATRGTAAAENAAARLGVNPLPPANPYWAEHGLTFQDADGFRVVLVPERWEGSRVLAGS